MSIEGIQLIAHTIDDMKTRSGKIADLEGRDAQDKDLQDYLDKVVNNLTATFVFIIHDTSPQEAKEIK